MGQAEVAGALQEYEDALAEFLTSVRARDTRSDFPLRQRLYAAGVEIERLEPSSSGRFSLTSNSRRERCRVS
jgi:hypothetical protein